MQTAAQNFAMQRIYKSIVMADEIEEFEYEEALTRYELVMIAATALDSMAAMDYGIMSQVQQRRREQVIRKSMRIIHYVIEEIYDETFEDPPIEANNPVSN